MLVGDCLGDDGIIQVGDQAVQDPRGNTDGIDAQFSLGAERLAWTVDRSIGGVDYPQIFTSPAQCVIDTLRAANDVLAIYDHGLPTQL